MKVIDNNSTEAYVADVTQLIEDMSVFLNEPERDFFVILEALTITIVGMIKQYEADGGQEDINRIKRALIHKIEFNIQENEEEENE